MHPPGPGAHVLDLETLHLARELPRGWRDLPALRVSCAVLHDVGPGRDVAFAERPVPDAAPPPRPLEDLHRWLEACRSEGCTLVGHNLRGFDWPVLAGEFHARGLAGHPRAWGPGAARLVDTMASLHRALGWRPGLDALARLNLGEGKSMDGALAPLRWRAGARAEVLAYCRRDVHLTLRVWQRGRAAGRVAVEALPGGGVRTVPVAW